MPSATEIASVKAQAETVFKDFSEGIETRNVIGHKLKTAYFVINFLTVLLWKVFYGCEMLSVC